MTQWNDDDVEDDEDDEGGDDDAAAAGDDDDDADDEWTCTQGSMMIDNSSLQSFVLCLRYMCMWVSVSVKIVTVDFISRFLSLPQKYHNEEDEVTINEL